MEITESITTESASMKDDFILNVEYSSEGLVEKILVDRIRRMI